MNSLTGRLDTFPSSSSPLKWYVCGPTVYDSAHLGHARSYVSQDILRRIVTQHFHQDIFLVMGMTDVDDKIIAAASAQQTSMANIARHHETAFLRNLAALNVLRVSSITRVSEHIPEIIGYIQGLDSNGFAYSTSDGVYFDTVAMGSSYGKLAPSTPQEYTDIVLEDGAVGGEKRNVRDFALWKLSKTPDEPGWESPWGRGRPGWHIECSAMTHHVLGGSIDVHSGGVDLRFPHHNNEIAQCDAYHHHQAGRYLMVGSCVYFYSGVDHTWCQHFVHFGHLYIKGLKMSKSLKNFITIDALLANYSADAFRLFCLQYKYNVNVHFSHDRMRDANAVYHRFHSFFHTLQSHVKATEAGGASERTPYARRVDAADFRVLDALAQCKLDVDSALRLDFNTPGALQHLLELVTATNKAWTDRPAMSVEVLCAVATYVMDTLALFGLDALRFPSLRLAAPVADDAASQSNAIQGADVMDVFTTFRAQVRALALTNTSDKVAQDILKLCDTVRCDSLLSMNRAIRLLYMYVPRDAQLPSLGIQIEDISPGKSFWKQQVDAPEAVEDNTSTEKAVLAAKAAEFEAEMQVAPASFFQLSPQFAGKFTAFDHEDTVDKMYVDGERNVNIIINFDIEFPKGFYCGSCYAAGSPGDVAGKVYFAPSRIFENGYLLDTDMLDLTFRSFDNTHHIKTLTFGQEYPNMKNPLNSRNKTLPSDQRGAFQYFLRVVSTDYSFLNGDEIKSNQYSVTEHFLQMTPTGHKGLPRVSFVYEFSPIKFRIEQTQNGLFPFFTSICAIVGGVFTVMGLVDSAMHQLSTKALKQPSLL
ncbi:hypothetical protein DYB35_004422 [Aphanomyces astaci]|uniref:cysteine--tRNA ligase n=1 Tax=Aphanomyces astaci TaxID=112090 RepID=A0A3R6XT60_APHAT|nr:hypothetical protein DYB35_004422 [Aphanomyces astaci]